MIQLALRAVRFVTLVTSMICSGVFLGQASAEGVGATAANVVALIASAAPTIKRANSDWLPAMMRGDVAALAAPYADNGVLLTSSGVSILGPEKIAAFYRTDLQQTGRIRGGALVEDGVTVSGGLIYEWGHAWLTVERKDGSRVRHGGQYLTVWRRTANGKWMIFRNLVL